MQTGHAPGPQGLARWWEQRTAERRAIALTVLDMRERYGPAAYGIARNSALRGGGGAPYRRFWQAVAARLRRGVTAGRGFRPLVVVLEAGPRLRAALRRLARA
jgi:hypothetical protein